MIGVGKQRKRQVVLRGELRLALFVKDAGAEDDGLARFELRQVVLERARLGGAAGRVVLRVEVEDDRLAGVVRERVRLAGLIFERKRGGFLAFVDERHPDSLAES